MQGNSELLAMGGGGPGGGDGKNAGSGAIPRNAKGQYAPRNGETGRDGAFEEGSAKRLMRAVFGRDKVVQSEVSVNYKGQLRKYDFGIMIDEKRVVGVEVKPASGGKYTAEQRSFDEMVNDPQRTTTLKTTGQNGNLELVGMVVVYIPGL